MWRAIPALLAMAPLPASATILSMENFKSLCVADHNGQKAVDPDKLALLVAGEAQSLFFLDGANPTGLDGDSIQTVGTAEGPSEPVYAILHAGEKPFGPNQAYDSDNVKAAVMALRAVLLRQLGMFLQHGTVEEDGFAIYRAISIDGSMSRDARSLFGPDRTNVILCAQPPEDQTPMAGSDSDVTASTKVALRLRGTSAALVSDDKLKDVAAATISYDRDSVAKKTSFAVSGVVGFVVTPDSGNFRLAPFVSYERKRVTGGADNVEKFAPGLLGALFLSNANASLHAKLELTYIKDIEQHAAQAKARIYLEPAFRLPGGGILFGSELGKRRDPDGNKHARLRFRPDFMGILDISHIYRRGTSAELKDAKSYGGFGGQAELKAYVDVDSWVRNVSLSIGARQLFMTGELGENSINRVFGSLEYASDDFPNFGIGFTFTRGENDDTFQLQKTYAVGVKLRY